MTSVLLCLVLAAAPCFAQAVRIGVFGLFHPVQLRLAAVRDGALEVRAGEASFVLRDNETAAVALRDGEIECRWRGGAVRSRSLSALPRDGSLILSVPGKIQRQFEGRLEIGASRNALRPVVVMDLEVAVASVVAAESQPGAPGEALKAQAIVARSFYVAAHRRHAVFDFCDTTHCQFLRAPPRASQAAARATVATRGLILAWHGTPVAALYSAHCGGRTRTPISAEPGDYPYFAVPCASCARGPRHGATDGHGIGLCQTGAAAMAASGAGFRAILEHYYPNTVLAPAR
ncbi:MAG TPA: SpoIID/LytB domain-containing protein [Bryobacteraceae bacterium]|nr:SpoIID/LytB domain-containing protein [Bryobacteraceae bacterium]